MTPTEKAISMAERIEELQGELDWYRQKVDSDKMKHEHEMRVQEAYVAGIKATLEALLDRKVRL